MLSFLPRPWLFLSAVASMVVGPGTVLGQQEGPTPTPPEQLEILLTQPGALEFKRAWIQKVERIRANREALEVREGPALSRGRIDAAGAAVTGTFRLPTLGALYSGQSALHTAADYQARLFDSTGVGRYTVTQHWDEMSLGALEVTGTVPVWPTLPEDAAYYRPTGGSDRYGNTGEFLQHTLDAVDPGLDFGLYDNDGPDGMPNSGDDDGYVDAVAFLYQDVPMSCGGPGIWPHRSVYESWWSGVPYTTDDPAAGGGFIRVSDYMIQSGVGCDGGSLMEIGTYSHEFGHALGLPDLYDTDNSSAGIGVWGLMGAGNWNIQSSPAHLSAWSKDFLGWLNVRTLTSDTTVSLEPVYAAGTVLRYDIPLSGEYFLLEHRSATGSDAFIEGEGLLVWHIDSLTVAAGMASNSVNADETRKGVDLEEADGLDELDAGGGADDGDPFPGSTGRSAFDPSTDPSSGAYDGGDSGLALGGISMGAGTVDFEVTLTAEPFLVAPEQVSLAVLAGDTVADTVAVTTHDGSDVGVEAAVGRPWLSVSPDSSGTPGSFVLTADASSLAAGEHRDTLVLSAPDAANAPLRLPVTLRVTSTVLALGDSVVGALTSSTQRDSLTLELVVGDTIDLAVFPTGPDPMSSPRVELWDPEGNILHSEGGRRPWEGNQECCRFAGLLTGFAPAVSGAYTVVVRGHGAGDYLLKVRSYGPVVHTDPDVPMDVVGSVGAGVTTDTVWISSSGAQAASWSGTTTAPWVDLTPSSGTLPGLGAPVAVQVEVDFDALPEGRAEDFDAIRFSLDDPWGGEALIRLNGWAMDPRVSTVVEGLSSPTGGVGVLSDDSLVVAVRENLVLVDPVTGAQSVLFADVFADGATWSRLGALDVAADGTVYVNEMFFDAVLRVAPDGAVSTVWNAPARPQDVVALPDGTVYVALHSTGIWRVDPDGTATNVAMGSSSCCHAALAFDEASGHVLFGNRSGLWRYDPAADTTSFVGELRSTPEGLSVGASGQIYARHADGVAVYDAAGSLMDLFDGIPDGRDLALSSGAVHTTLDGCLSGGCGDYGRLLSAPVPDGPQGGSVLVVRGSRDFGGEPGDTLTSVLDVAMTDSTEVGVDAATGASWLTATPDSGSTPFALTLQAVVPDTAAGTLLDTLVLTAPGVANAPLRLPVRLEVALGLLAVGDSLRGRIDVPGERDTVRIHLAAGDTVDIAAMGDPAEPGVAVELYDPDGAWAAYPLFRPAAGPGGPRGTGLVGGFVAPTSGIYSLVVRSWASAGTPDYTAKARRSGPVLATVANGSFDATHRLYLPVQEGAAMETDTVWLANAGRGPLDWTAVSHASWISVSPSSGTLGSTDYPPVGGTPLVVTVQPGARSPGWRVEYLGLQATNDDWLGPWNAQMEPFIYDSEVVLTHQRLEAWPRGLADHPDGDLVMAIGQSLERVDPATGVRTVWAADVTGPAPKGLEVDDGGNAYWVSGSGLHRMAPDGSVEELLDNSVVFGQDLALVPDGSIWITSWDGLHRWTEAGGVEDVATDDAYSGVAYHPGEDAIFAARGRAASQGYTLRRFDPGTLQGADVSAQASTAPMDLKVGREGRLYGSHRSLQPHIRILDTDGTVVDQVWGPGFDGSIDGGIALTEGRVWATTSRPYYSLYHLPVDDGPSRPEPVVLADAWIPDVAGSAGDTVDVEVYLDVSAAGEGLGDWAGTLAWDTAVARFVALDSADFQGDFTGDATAADGGAVSLGGLNAEPAANTDTTRVARLRLEMVGAGADSTLLDLELASVLGAGGAVLDTAMVVTDGTLTLVTGMWGDANRDDAIAALDALVCLSAVVGRDVGTFDVTACDVAPDPPEGSTFDGTISALDALAVLTHVVGRALPASFRVGEGR